MGISNKLELLDTSFSVLSGRQFMMCLPIFKTWFLPMLQVQCMLWIIHQIAIDFGRCTVYLQNNMLCKYLYSRKYVMFQRANFHLSQTSHVRANFYMYTYCMHLSMNDFCVNIWAYQENPWSLQMCTLNGLRVIVQCTVCKIILADRNPKNSAGSV